MLPGGNVRQTAPSATPRDQEVVVECAEQLRHIGDKWNLRQTLLNLPMKLLVPADEDGRQRGAHDAGLPQLERKT